MQKLGCLTLLLIFAGLVEAQAPAPQTVAATLTTARSSDGKYISWREHLIDDEALGGVAMMFREVTGSLPTGLGLHGSTEI